MLILGAELNFAFVRGVFPQNRFEQRCFSAAVRADDEDALLPLGFNRDMLKQAFILKGKREIFRVQTSIAAAVGN